MVESDENNHTHDLVLEGFEWDDKTGIVKETLRCKICYQKSFRTIEKVWDVSQYIRGRR